MEITEGNLAKFRNWVMERGRVEGTAALYVTNLRSCADDPRGLTNRLISGDLSPNSLRTNLAALRSWATFSGDGQLMAKLSDLRLPPARRVKSKPPLTRHEWEIAVRHLQTCEVPSEAMRQALLIIALRGLRVGDVLRMRRQDIQRAVETGKLSYEGKGRKRIEISAAPIMAQMKALTELGGGRWSRVRDLVSDSENPAVAIKRVRRQAKRTALEVGISGMNPHRYRHTFATNYLSQLSGDPNAIIKLQRYMGWESMGTAARYVDSVSQDELDTIGDKLVHGLVG
jgi:integrase